MINQKQRDDSKNRASQQGGSGSSNFADNPQRASEAGTKGGQHSHGGQQNQSSVKKQADDQQSGSNQARSQGGNAGSFSNDPQKASEAGKKGGSHSHGGK